MATQRVQIPISFQTESTVYAPLTNGGAAQQQTVMIPVPNAPVSVFVRNANGSAGSPATVYADATSSTQLASITTDAGGNVPGYVVEGSYLITAGSITINGQVYPGATIAWDAVRGDGVENIYPGAVITAAIASGAVTLAQLATAVAQALVPTGTILEFGGSTAPSGYLLCNGQAVSRTTYANLWNTIGSAYGAGDGSTTFNVPNLTGRFALGATGVAPYTLGASGGALGHTHSIPSLSIPSLSIPSLFVSPASIPALAIPQHTHPLSANGGAAIQVHQAASSIAFGPVSSSGFSIRVIEGYGTNDFETTSTGTHSSTALSGTTDKSSASLFTASSSTGSTSTASSSTGGGATGTGTTGAADPAYLAVTRIIKV